MWDEICRYLPTFPSAVVTGIDRAGYPFSVQCHPEPDSAARVLRLVLPDYVGFQRGPAGLLCHMHDERLWNLRSFIVRGTLEKDSLGWLFRPEQFIPGAGLGGMLGLIKFLRDGRRTADQYLKKRGMARPQVAWDEIHATWAAVKERRLMNAANRSLKTRSEA